jgi:hypothetical protein
MPITVVPGSILMNVTQRPKVATPVVDGTSMSFKCEQGIKISGRCTIKGNPGDDPEGWILGLIQLQWIETNWGYYRGQSNSDGSCLLQRARPPAREAKGCRDTLTVGEIFVDNDPGKNSTVAKAGTALPFDMTAQFSDAPGDAYPLTRPNSLTGKTNFLQEVQLEFHFCTILALKDPAGNFRHLKHLLWNVHWQAQFRPTDYVHIAADWADWTITPTGGAMGNTANVSNEGKAYDGGPPPKFTEIATDQSAPNCNEVATKAFYAPNTTERPVWHDFDVTV